MTICVVCFAEEHNIHKCTGIDKIAEKFSERLQDDVTKIDSITVKVSEKLSQLAEESLKFTRKVKSMEESIIKQGQDMKTLIDKQTSELLLELKSIETENLKKLETVKQELEREELIVQSFTKYGKELKDNGTSCEIARVADDLHARANELQESILDQSNFRFIDMTFTATELQKCLTSDNANLVGNIAKRNVNDEGKKCL